MSNDKKITKDIVQTLEMAQAAKSVIEDNVKNQEITPEDVKKQAEALQTVLKSERPADKIKILKILLKEAQLHEQILDKKDDKENELVEHWETAEYPYKHPMDKKRYKKELYRLQVELLKMQSWVKENNRKIIIIFEGRDAAGKGGTISRFMEHMNPRGARIAALPKPTDQERGQWYFQRYVAHLPNPGEIVLFDRSWYNRAGVERVMGFCTDEQYYEFLRQCPLFEQNLIRSDTIMVKFWFSVTREEQARRFKARRIDPLKRWKLSPIDIASISKWDDYTRAEEAMFFSTNTNDSPWIVIKSDDKMRARLNAIRYVLSVVPYDNKDEEAIGKVDPLILSRANVTGNITKIFKSPEKKGKDKEKDKDKK